MEIESSAFKSNEFIPEVYSCQGADKSPPILIKNSPDKTNSFAIIVDDPDAPSGIFVHWVAWNLSSKTTWINEGENIPLSGKNSFGTLGYKGPCPPPGKPHRYFFKVYALDTKLTLKAGATKQELEKAMEGHILGEAELIGLFQR